MRKIFKLLACTSVITLLSVATALAAIPGSQLSSVLVVEDGKPIGSLTSPAAGDELRVNVTEGNHQLQVFLQFRAVPGDRRLVVTEMKNAVVTALAKQGVIGKRLKGGWELEANQEEDVLVTVTGRSPVGAKEFDLVGVVLLTSEVVATEARVRGLLQEEATPLPVWSLLAVGSGTITVAALGFWLWSRRSRFNAGRWS